MTSYSELLKPEECLLLVVDAQQVMLAPCAGAARCRRNMDALLEIAGIVGLPVVFSEHNSEKLGGVVPELSALAPGAPVLNKLEFSCFQNDTLRRAIEAADRGTIILCGLETHVCIFHTGAGALETGRRVHVVADAVCSRSRLNHRIGLRRLERAGAVVTSTEMVIFELLNRAGTPQFRKALPLIKRL